MSQFNEFLNVVDSMFCKEIRIYRMYLSPLAVCVVREKERQTLNELSSPDREYQNSMVASRRIIYDIPVGVYTRIECSIAAIILRRKGEGKTEVETATSAAGQVENTRRTRSHLTRSGQLEYPPPPASLFLSISPSLFLSLFFSEPSPRIDACSYTRPEILWEIESGHAAFAVAPCV